MDSYSSLFNKLSLLGAVVLLLPCAAAAQTFELHRESVVASGDYFYPGDYCRSVTAQFAAVDMVLTVGPPSSLRIRVSGISYTPGAACAPDAPVIQLPDIDVTFAAVPIDIFGQTYFEAGPGQNEPYCDIRDFYRCVRVGDFLVSVWGRVRSDGSQFILSGLEFLKDPVDPARADTRFYWDVVLRPPVFSNSLPNLSIDSVTLDRNTTVPGGTIGISSVTNNRSLFPSPASTTRFYLDLTNSRTQSSIQLLGNESVPALASNTTYTNSTVAVVPAFAPPGDFHVVSCADDANWVVELDEQDNCTGSTTTIHVGSEVTPTSISDPPGYLHIGPPPLPIGPSSAFPDPISNLFVVQDTYQNTSTVASTTTFASYFLSVDGRARSFPLLGARTVPSLQPGASDSRTVSLEVVSSTPAGRYFVVSCVADACRNSAGTAVVVNLEGAVTNGTGFVVPSGNADMSWVFTPNFGLTVKQAAELGGYDHFNWYQRIVDNTLGPLPNPIGFYVGLDPQLGGNRNQRVHCNGPGADYLPWYFNESLLGCADADDLFIANAYASGGGRNVGFFDAPDVCIPGTVLTFETYLAGVRSDGTGDVLWTIPGVNVSWKFTQHLPCPFGSGSVSDITVGQNTLNGSGHGLSEFVSFVDPRGVSADDLRALRSAGALPATATMSVSPTSARQSESVRITVRGHETHFEQGVSAMTVAGTGVEVEEVTVITPSQAIAVVRIASDALPFERSVYMTTGDEVAVARNAFSVIPVAPTYSWSGVLPPIDPFGSSVFKAGSTVPVKFRLTGDSAGVDSLVPVLRYEQVAGDKPGVTTNTDPTGVDGEPFRYDAAAAQYILNWRTKGLSVGLYRLTIDLGDRVQRSVVLRLR